MGFADNWHTRGATAAFAFFTKTSAQRARAVARQMAAAGDLAGAQRVISAPGVVSPTSSGVPIKNLGSGGEGVAQLAFHPQYGNVVKKTYNPAGHYYSPELIARKEKLAPELNQNPAFTKLQGVGRTPRGVPVHYMEHVQGTTPNPFAPETQQAVEHLRNTPTSTGHKIEDVHADNMLKTPSGQMKAIDYAPYTSTEIEALNKGETPASLRMNPGAQRLPMTPAQTLATAYGGVAPPKPKAPLAAAAGQYEDF